MKHFCGFFPSGESFEDRDHSSALCSALGRAALAHAELAKRVDATIQVLADNVQQSPGQFDEWSLARKFEVLSSLITANSRRLRFNVGTADASEVSKELIGVLRTADDLCRRTLADPTLLRLHLERDYPESLSAQIMDVVDYLAYAGSVLDEFFLVAAPVM